MNRPTFVCMLGNPNSGPHFCDGAVLTEPSLLRFLTGPVAHQSASQAVQQAPGTCPPPAPSSQCCLQGREAPLHPVSYMGAGIQVLMLTSTN